MNLSDEIDEGLNEWLEMNECNYWECMNERDY
jgi:hypothetical protein